MYGCHHLLRIVVFVVPLFVLLGCGGPGGGRAFLDEKKDIDANLEWNREITAKAAAPMKFRLTSQGPFAVSLLTDRGYKAVMSKDKKGFGKEDVVFTVDSKDTSIEQTVTMPAGSSWFIIENQAGKKVTFHLQCFPK